MRKKKIPIPIFCGHLTIVHDKDLKWVEKKYKTSSLDNYGAVTIKDESNYRHYVVAFETNDRSNIAHEIVHVINYIFIDCGVELDRQNDETQAYLTGWLFYEIDKFITRPKGKTFSFSLI
jgi:hypothetical protein